MEEYGMAQVVDTTDFYVGLKFRWQDGIWEIVDYDHHKMGRGDANYQIGRASCRERV